MTTFIQDNQSSLRTCGLAASSTGSVLRCWPGGRNPAWALLNRANVRRASARRSLDFFSRDLNLLIFVCSSRPTRFFEQGAGDTARSCQTLASGAPLNRRQGQRPWL
jgi:hypothetical protein